MSGKCSVDSEWINVQLTSLSTIRCSLQSFSVIQVVSDIGLESIDVLVLYS